MKIGTADHLAWVAATPRSPSAPLPKHGTRASPQRLRVPPHHLAPAAHDLLTTSSSTGPSRTCEHRSKAAASSSKRRVYSESRRWL